MHHAVVRGAEYENLWEMVSYRLVASVLFVVWRGMVFGRKRHQDSAWSYFYGGLSGSGNIACRDEISGKYGRHYFRNDFYSGKTANSGSLCDIQGPAARLAAI